MSIVATTPPAPAATRTKTRIRFAPLPDPRRAVLITETGEELPLQAWLHHHTDSLYEKLSLVSSPTPLDADEDNEDEDCKQPSSIPASVSIAAFFTDESSRPGSSTSSVSEATLEAHQHKLSSPPPPPNVALPILSSPSSSSKKSGGFFSRFKTGSLMNLNEKEDGNALRRWTSGSSAGSSSLFEPLNRTQSTQSYKGDNVRSRTLSNLNPFSSSSSDSGSAAATTRRRKRPSSAQGAGLIGTMHDQKPSTRMLNGRVYGAKRHSMSSAGNPQKNPFANVQDAGSEFVEWGYGGMGSVRNTNVGGSVWGKVQSSDGGDDDGGGMEWVRKRREQREREKKEREAKEKEEAEAKESTATLTPPPTSEPPTLPSPTPEQRPTSPPNSTFSSGMNTPKLDHITRAINVPAPPHHHHHKHSNSQVSIHTVTDKPTSPTPEALPVKEEEQESSSEEEEKNDEQDNDEQDDEEEEEEERQRNMQSIGAGVEKISRHKS